MKRAAFIGLVWLALGFALNAWIYGRDQAIVFLGVALAVLLDLSCLWNLGRALVAEHARPTLLLFLVSFKVFALAMVGVAVWYFHSHFGARGGSLFMGSLTIVVVPTALVGLGKGHGS